MQGRMRGEFAWIALFLVTLGPTQSLSEDLSVGSAPVDRLVDLSTDTFMCRVWIGRPGGDNVRCGG